MLRPLCLRVLRGGGLSKSYLCQVLGCRWRYGDRSSDWLELQKDDRNLRLEYLSTDSANWEPVWNSYVKPVLDDNKQVTISVNFEVMHVCEGALSEAGLAAQITTVDIFIISCVVASHIFRRNDEERTLPSRSLIWLMQHSKPGSLFILLNVTYVPGGKTAYRCFDKALEGSGVGFHIIDPTNERKHQVDSRHKEKNSGEHYGNFFPKLNIRLHIQNCTPPEPPFAPGPTPTSYRFCSGSLKTTCL